MPKLPPAIGRPVIKVGLGDGEAEDVPWRPFLADPLAQAIFFRLTAEGCVPDRLEVLDVLVRETRLAARLAEPALRRLLRVAKESEAQSSGARKMQADRAGRAPSRRKGAGRAEDWAPSGLRRSRKVKPVPPVPDGRSGSLPWMRVSDLMGWRIYQKLVRENHLRQPPVVTLRKIIAVVRREFLRHDQILRSLGKVSAESQRQRDGVVAWRAEHPKDTFAEKIRAAPLAKDAELLAKELHCSVRHVQSVRKQMLSGRRRV